MKIAIYDPSDCSYTVSTPYRESLDLAQASLCYLSVALAQQSHQIVFLNATKEPAIDRGVICLPWKGISRDLLSSVDIVIVFNGIERGEEIAKHLEVSTRLVLFIDSTINSNILTSDELQKPGVLESFDAIFFQNKKEKQSFDEIYPQSQALTYFVQNKNYDWQDLAFTWMQKLQEVCESDFYSQTAYRYFLKEEYEYAMQEYEKAIAKQSDLPENYWYYGLCLLLQEQEEEAQAAWFYPFLELDIENEDVLTKGLVDRLDKAAYQFESIQKDSVAWALRQHIRELNPTNLNNTISLIRLSMGLHLLNEHEYIIYDFAKILKSEQLPEDRFEDAIQILVDFLKSNPKENIIDPLIEAYRQTLSNNEKYRNIFLSQKLKILNNKNLPFIGTIKICNLALSFQPNRFSLWTKLSGACYLEERYREAIYATQRMLETASNDIEKIISYYQLIRGMLNSGEFKYYQLIKTHEEEYLGLLNYFLDNCNFEANKQDIDDINSYFQVITAACYFPYLYDNPSKMHKWRGKVGCFWHKQLQKYIEKHKIKNIGLSKTTTKISKSQSRIKIGYISSSLRRHSVGYLSGWFFQEYNREKFDFYVYSLNHTQDPLALFFEQNSYFRDLTNESKLTNIANAIQEDDIDILIDLDSLTDQKVSRVMLMKPAPIQATWLGFDASGIPTIDYFIADPYVLPENAHEYYNETIWRLPQTYIAVGGFDVGSPSLRREDLEISKDAVIFFSSQTGSKRNSDNIRLQMRILREVPNSYFITKTMLGDQESIQAFFTEIAAEEGVDSNRLRFLPRVNLEAVHRANIAIADVVLDTYPYNGATTTMETLWMEVPMVTRVGEQFAARNSYAMMVNAGIEEGIAWTDEEYVEWGIRLGKEPQLRKEISWKLKQSKKSAPLWNAKQFTRDMEAAYQQMWQKYIDESSE
ncbi:O-linked N-acetylglucosamine transferase, SPINDLY family protein [Geitlerinema sp. PCC 9228]|uniref:O-linked N-acetylglucosamine transferase, SPINDLY family protein n=1 Tax=Geitlerinema sp. PCC 9228 TaxID=111611 RepID=UPI000AAD058B|nr:O-linked N-acetylglucosamine transferase, SPINDLY family protein [Geitlerinema sp. PCC 9228]